MHSVVPVPGRPPRRGSPGTRPRLAPALVILLTPFVTLGAEPPHPVAESTRPAAPGVHFTPEMARSLSALFVREVLARHYELPDGRAEEARDRIARRLMQCAHRIDAAAEELAERYLEEQLEYVAGRDSPRPIPPGFVKEFAERLLPILPEIRELVRSVGQDIRPMLPMRKQVQLAGELMAFKTGIDGFEASMRKWADGRASGYADPFEEQHLGTRDASGETQRLKNIRTFIARDLARSQVPAWRSYLEEFKKLYGLDPAQSATAESVFREYQDREAAGMADPRRRERLFRAQLWDQIGYELPDVWMHPVRQLIVDELAEARAAGESLEDEFKGRLESIPTLAQRKAVEERVSALLENRGVKSSEARP
jgi:hypothetical protein